MQVIVHGFLSPHTFFVLHFVFKLFSCDFWVERHVGAAV